MIDIQNGAFDIDTTSLSQVDFSAWFKRSVSGVYAEKIPHTVKYLCLKLDKEDPWVDFIIQRQETGQQLPEPPQNSIKLDVKNSSKLS